MTKMHRCDQCVLPAGKTGGAWFLSSGPTRRSAWITDRPFLSLAPFWCPFFLDAAIKADINQWRIKLDNYSTQELGRTIVYLNGSAQECRFRECNMGNLICDAMVRRLQGKAAASREGGKEDGEKVQQGTELGTLVHSVSRQMDDWFHTE